MTGPTWTRREEEGHEGARRERMLTRSRTTPEERRETKSANRRWRREQWRRWRWEHQVADVPRIDGQACDAGA